MYLVNNEVGLTAIINVSFGATVGMNSSPIPVYFFTVETALTKILYHRREKKNIENEVYTIVYTKT